MARPKSTIVTRSQTDSLPVSATPVSSVTGTKPKPSKGRTTRQSQTPEIKQQEVIKRRLKAQRRNLFPSAISPSKLPPMPVSPPRAVSYPSTSRGLATTVRVPASSTSPITPRLQTLDFVQLARIYVHITRKSSSKLSETKHTKAKSKKRSEQNRKKEVAATLRNLLEAVALQPSVQTTVRRIVAVSQPGDQLPDTVDPAMLGLTLKVRLAATAPCYRQVADLDGRLNITTYCPKWRQMPVYEFDEKEQDPNQICYLKVQRAKTTI